MPEELFFQSILLGTDFARHHGVVDDDLRFLHWNGAPHPLTLTTNDLPDMLDSGKLFARKFDATVDGTVLAHLMERITA